LIDQDTQLESCYNVSDINLAEGQKVRLVVEPFEKPDDVLALAAQVHEGLSEDQIDSVEQYSRRRENFFEEGTSP
jgi:hypothetical protein